MKVLVITPFYNDPHRGVASAYKTATELKRHGMEVVVLTARSRRQPAESVEGGIRVYRTRDIFLPDPFNFNILPNLWGRLWSVLRQERPDVVLISKYVFFTALAAPLLKLRRQPFVFTTDTFPGICWFSPFKARDRLVAIYTKTLGRWLMNMAGAVVLLHENLLPYAKQLRLKRTVVIHNGVEQEAFLAHPQPRDIRKKRGEVIITYIGRLESVKGWEAILRVARKITRRHPNVRFLFVGNKEGRRVGEDERISFLGYRQDIRGILAATDINVLFSSAEGLPNTVMEAMAAGLPVVASDVGGVGCLVKDGETGLLVPRGDEKALEAALERLIGDAPLRRRLGDAGRRLVKEEFSWARIAGQYDRLFREIVGEQR